MAHIWKDRVLETSTTTGTAALTLAGAVTGFRAFSTVMTSPSDTCYYYAEGVDGSDNPSGEWETGLATYSGANTLTRTTVVDSSNAGAAVSFSAGTKRVGLGSAQGFARNDPSGNLVLTYTGLNTVPPAESIGVSAQQIASGAGRVVLRGSQADGTFTTWQGHIGRNQILHHQPSGNSSTAINVVGLGLLTGTGTGRTIVTTSVAKRARRNAFVTAATAAAVNGYYNSSAPMTPYTVGGAAGGGFLAIFVFIPSDAATVAGAHRFVGMTNLNTAMVAATNPNTYTNCIGIAQLNGGANLNIVYGGSAAQTSIDLGANFPAGGLSTDMYEFTIYARPDDATKVSYRVERINTGDVASGVLTGTAGTAIPANTTLMGPRFTVSNNATALAAGLDFVTLYVESGI